MAALFDSKFAVAVGKAPTLIHAPTGDNVVLSILLTNTFYGELPVNVWVEHSGGRLTQLAIGVRVPRGGSFDPLLGGKLSLAATDRVMASCPAEAGFSAVLSSYEEK